MDLNSNTILASFLSYGTKCWINLDPQQFLNLNQITHF